MERGYGGDVSVSSRAEPDEPPLVLIVDDNEKNRKLARDVLRAAGFQTLEAATGAEAIALAARARCPDVILMDLRLPDMDGTDVARELGDDAADRADPGRRAELAAARRRRATGSARGLRRLPREADQRRASSRTRCARYCRPARRDRRRAVCQHPIEPPASTVGSARVRRPLERTWTDSADM